MNYMESISGLIEAANTAMLGCGSGSASVSLLSPPRPSSSSSGRAPAHSPGSSMRMDAPAARPMSTIPGHGHGMGLDGISVRENVRGGKWDYSKRKPRKHVDDYASDYADDFVARTVPRSATEADRLLVCRYCNQKIGARSDRIKEHLASKKHNANKQNAKLGILGLGVTKGKASKTKPSSSSPTASLLPKIEAPGKIVIEETSAGSSSSSAQMRGCGRDLQEFRKKQKVHLSLEDPISVRDKLRHFLLTGQFSDITLMCEGDIIKSHKMILSSHSSYFEVLLSDPQLANQPNSVVLVNCVKSWELKACLELMYGGEITVSEHQLLSLNVAMNRLRIQSVVKNGLQSNTAAGDRDGFGHMKLSSKTSKKSKNLQGQGQQAFSMASGSRSRVVASEVPIFIPMAEGGRGGKINKRRSSNFRPILPKLNDEILEHMSAAASSSSFSKSMTPVPDSMDALNPLDLVQSTFSGDEDENDDSDAHAENADSENSISEEMDPAINEDESTVASEGHHGLPEGSNNCSADDGDEDGYTDNDDNESDMGEGEEESGGALDLRWSHQNMENAVSCSPM